MGTHSSAHSRAARTAALIGTEDEAITVAGTVAEVFDFPAEGGAAA
jgi:hypothetical protein